jgi:hypothetical protein
MTDPEPGGDDKVFLTRTTQAEGQKPWITGTTAPGGARLLQDLTLDPVPDSDDPQSVESAWSWHDLRRLQRCRTGWRCLLA